MKRDKYYNTYFLGNLAQTKDSVAFIQSIEKQGAEEFIVRVVKKPVVAALCQDSPKSENSPKEFLAYDPVTTADRSISLPAIPKLTVFSLAMDTFDLPETGQREDLIFVATSSGLMVIHDGLFKTKNLHDKFIQYTFTSLLCSAPHIFVAQYGGLIEKVLLIVEWLDSGWFRQSAVYRPERDSHLPGLAQRHPDRWPGRRQRPADQREHRKDDR